MADPKQTRGWTRKADGQAATTDEVVEALAADVAMLRNRMRDMRAIMFATAVLLIVVAAMRMLP